MDNAKSKKWLRHFFEKAALRYAHSPQLARTLRDKNFSDVHAAGKMI